MFDLPVHHLDDVASDPTTGLRRSNQDRVLAIQRIAASARWVTDGVQTGWTDELCERADMIVWLDQVGGYKAWIRITRRFARQAFSEFRRQRGWRRFLRLRSYVHHSRGFLRSLFEVRAFDRALPSAAERDAGSRAATAAQLEPYLRKVVHCRSTLEVEALIGSLRAGTALTGRPGAES